MYRDIVKTSKSFYRFTYSAPSVFVATKLGQLSGSFVAKIASAGGLDGKDFSSKFEDDLQLGFLVYSVATRAYLDMRQSGKAEIVAFRYEDLVDNPVESVRRLLEYCRLPIELVEQGLRCMEFDSQRSSSLWSKDSPLYGVRLSAEQLLVQVFTRFVTGARTDL
jgi:hypothetical protein